LVVKVFVLIKKLVLFEKYLMCYKTARISTIQRCYSRACCPSMISLITVSYNLHKIDCFKLNRTSRTLNVNEPIAIFFSAWYRAVIILQVRFVFKYGYTCTVLPMVIYRTWIIISPRNLNETVSQNLCEMV